MENDDITLNISKSNSTTKQIKEKSNNKKEEKFLKYTEKKKMLNQKRTRTPVQENYKPETRRPRFQKKEVPNRKRTKSKIEIIEREIQKNINEDQDMLYEDRELTTTVFSINNFTDLEINSFLKKELEKHHFTQMTKIQKKAIPVILKYQNVVFKSETGSGKTLAYVIPTLEILDKINKENKIERNQGTFVLVFAPTHELCLQIEETFNKLKSCNVGIVNGTLLGGQKISKEKSKIRKGLNIIICTPGRLLYHLRNTVNLNFSNLKMIIFDEADRLLDMGFEKEIRECMTIVMQQLNLDASKVESFNKIKICLISATLGQNIKVLASDLMTEFKTVGFTKDNEDNIIIPEGLNQFYTQVFDEFKLIHLIAFLYCNRAKKVIIFVSSCETVNFLYELLKDFEFINGNIKLFSSVEMLKLHGKMKHDERKVIFKSFFNSTKSFLISTDVASRGLDFPVVDIIVHYDVNPERKDYVNRMGRTARLDQKGNSVLFLMQNEQKLLETCFSEFSIKNLENKKILTCFVNKFNKEIYKKTKETTETEGVEYLESLNTRKQDLKDDKFLDSDSYYQEARSVIDPIRKSIKNYIFKDRENLILARSALNTSIKAYTTFFKYQKDVFNAKSLNLTRFAKSFGLFKEKSTFKLGTEEFKIDQRKDQMERRHELVQKQQEMQYRKNEANKNMLMLSEFM